MELVFIRSNEDFENVASLVFKSLGIGQFLEGESQNVLGGHYYSFSVFGIEIKLEINSYDYEDEYKYMVQIKNDFVTPLNGATEIEYLFSELVLKLFKNNLDMTIAIERNDMLIRIK